MRVLVVCYQIERGKGSEAGSGYNFVRALSDIYPDITVLTRHNNAQLLREDDDLRDIRVVGYDPPRWVTRLKRRNRAIIPFYYLWQLGAGRLAARLHAENPFTAVHQYNFHTDWAPHFLRIDDAKTVWGPICHQPTLPFRYLQLERIRGTIREVCKAAAKRLFWHADPNLRRAIRATDVILFANADVPGVFRRSGKVRQQTFGGAIPGQVPPTPGSGVPLRLIHVGRAVSIKGAAVALDALERAVADGANATLTLVGDGPLRARLEEKAADLGLTSRVRFLPWMSREQLTEQYATSDAFLYPSLGNQDGVVAEALAASLPVLGVAPSGTATMAGEAGLWAPRSGYARTIAGLAEGISTLAQEAASDPDAWADRRLRALRRSEELSWAATAQAVAASYR